MPLERIFRNGLHNIAVSQPFQTVGCLFCFLFFTENPENHRAAAGHAGAQCAVFFHVPDNPSDLRNLQNFLKTVAKSGGDCF